MIEVIYKEESQEVQNGEESFGLPRNIRQIGQTGENYKIYMEDYVYTFLVRLARNEDTTGELKARVAVLTGDIKWRSQEVYLFVKGAVVAEEMDAVPDHIDFSGEQWKQIQKDQKEYFEDQEIVGWFFSQPQLSMEVSEVMTKVHTKHFGGEKVLMLMEPQEREDAFFHYENNKMVQLGGYYLYYEKNPGMQTYMINKNKELQPEKQEQYEDKAVKNFRKIIADKKEIKKESAAPSVFSYGLTACLAIAVLTVGVNFYRNYENIRQTEKEESATVSSVIVEEVTPSPSVMIKKDVNSRNVSRKNIQSNRSHAENKQSETKPLPTTQVENEDKTEQIYQQEADERKAKKRIREAAEKENSEASGKVHESYVIQPGDTLFQISMEKYGNTEAISQICRLNGMSADEIIYPGQVIVLP